MMILSVVNYKYFRQLNVAAAYLSQALRFVSIRDRRLRRR